MCLLVYKPASKPFPLGDVEKICQSNPDGFGMMLLDQQITSPIKYLHRSNDNSGPASVKAITALIEAHQSQALVLHWRRKSDGKVSLKNCHPAPILSRSAKAAHGGQIWLFHNGVIGSIEKAGEESDTRAFARLALRPVGDLSPSLLLDSSWLSNMVCRAIGRDKMIIVDSVGVPCEETATGYYTQLMILNKSYGQEVDDIWYSNRFFQAVTYQYAVGYHYGGYGSQYGDGWEQFDSPSGGRMWRKKQAKKELIAPDKPKPKHLVPVERDQGAGDLQSYYEDKYETIIDHGDFSDIFQLCSQAPDLVTEYIVACLEDYGLVFLDEKGGVPPDASLWVLDVPDTVLHYASLYGCDPAKITAWVDSKPSAAAALLTQMRNEELHP